MANKILSPNEFADMVREHIEQFVSELREAGLSEQEIDEAVYALLRGFAG